MKYAGSLESIKGTEYVNPATFGDVQALARHVSEMHRAFGVSTPNITDFVRKAQKLSPTWLDALAGMGDLYFHEGVISYHMALRWADFGLSVFDLTTSLLASLLLTDCSGVEPDAVRFPFPTFVVRVPGDFWTIRVQEKGQESPVTAIWAHQFRALDQNDGEEKLRLVIKAVSRLGTSVWEVRDLPERSTSIEEWVSTSYENFETGGPLCAVDQEDFRMQRAVRRMLVNLCLYISERGYKGTQQGKKTTKKRKRKKAREQKHELKPSVWVLGHEVKLNRQLLDAARDRSCDESGAETRWRVRKRFVVQGHWRNQACGPGRKERKRIRIEPYWKGPKEGERLSHLYTFTKEKTDE
jgi:hypothetical protein